MFRKPTYAELEEKIQKLEHRESERNQSPFVLKDAAEFIRCQEILNYQKLQFEAVFNNLDAAIYVSDMDTKEILFVNKYMNGLFKMNLVGEICWKSLHNNESGPCEFCTNAKLIDADGNPAQPYVWEIYNQKLDKWYELHDQAISWVDGRLVRMEIAFDITDRKKESELLKASERRFREIIEDVSKISIQGYDNDRKVIFWNQASADLYGFTRKEALGKKLEDLIIPSGMREHVKNLHHRWIKFGEKIPAGELDLIGKNGDIVPVYSSHVMHETINVKEMFCIDIDLNPIKQAEREKFHAQKIASEQKQLAVIGQIAGKMAHDFNNILTIILGNSELALLNCNDEKIEKILELIINQSLRGSRLIGNLVAFAKSQEPKHGFFRINEKIDLVLNLMRKDLKNIQLRIGHAPDIPDLLGDPGMFEHALVNLIQNSIHATNKTEHPRITIRTYCSDRNIYLEIEDNGCGIPKMYLKDIYNPSFSLKDSEDVDGPYTGIKGSGYGMANVKKYIDQHKGQIWVESVVGSGTKFTISFPVIEKQLSKKEKTELQKEIKHFEKYILLVEDEQAISDVQYRILTQNPCNHKVDTANNGQDAMNLFNKNQYDFISLDYVLPGNFNGLDVYKHIRETNKTIPIVFVSGSMDFLESIKDLKQKDRYVDHLSKPCMNIDYIKTINKLMTRVG